MKLIVGLGNPGEKYQNTRHNVGFIAVEALAKRLHMNDWEDSSPYFGEITKNADVVLLKPTTFMNLSGNSVKKVMSDKGIELNDIWVIQDEADLPFGSIRVKKGGSDAGHNGIKSIDEANGQDYWRIRLGIGKEHQSNLTDHVLDRFNHDEQRQLEDVIDQVTDLLVKFLESDIEPITINN